jgi:hypothetical protein
MTIPRAKQDEILAAYERITELETTLEQCREYFTDRSDVIDGDYGIPAPNKEMRMLQEIDEVMS